MTVISVFGLRWMVAGRGEKVHFLGKVLKYCTMYCMHYQRKRDELMDELMDKLMDELIL